MSSEARPFGYDTTDQPPTSIVESEARAVIERWYQFRRDNCGGLVVPKKYSLMDYYQGVFDYVWGYDEHTLLVKAKGVASIIQDVTPPEGFYLVPKDEYEKEEGEFGFVVDPYRHPRIVGKAVAPLPSKGTYTFTYKGSGL